MYCVLYKMYIDSVDSHNEEMNEALDLILNAVTFARGSEIFVPKLRAYSIIDVKNTLTELLTDTGEKIIGIRTGEKIHTKERISIGFKIPKKTKHVENHLENNLVKKYLMMFKLYFCQ